MGSAWTTYLKPLAECAIKQMGYQAVKALPWNDSETFELAFKGKPQDCILDKQICMAAKATWDRTKDIWEENKAALPDGGDIGRIKATLQRGFDKNNICEKQQAWELHEKMSGGGEESPWYFFFFLKRNDNIDGDKVYNIFFLTAKMKAGAGEKELVAWMMKQQYIGYSEANKQSYFITDEA
jgi:hypothetical protein